MAHSVQWLALVGYGVLVFLVAPRAEHHRGFLWARSREGAAPSTALLTASVLVTWIFAKSITNAANLGEKSERSRYSFDLRVSLDGLTAEQNDPVRGRGTFEQVVAALRRLGRAGLSPAVTVVEHEEGLAGADARAEFLQFVRDLGIRQPRVKFLPLLRIGREERRTHGYQDAGVAQSAPLLPEVESSLLCASGRIVTAQGVYTCPILIEHATARLGDHLAETARSIQLRWDACQTCVLDGLRCNT